MQPTSLKRVLGFAEKHYPGQPREYLLGEINKVRQVFWKSPGKRELIFKTDGIEPAQRFRDLGQWGFHCSYMGIALPVNITSIEYLQINGRRVPVQSQELENLPGPYVVSSHRPVAEVESTKVCFQYDIPVNNRGPVCFFALDASDNGKRIGVEYLVASGQIVREDILVSASGPETTQVPIMFRSVTLPERNGMIRVQTADNFVLGSYHPSITAPRHLRLHINGLCLGRVVEWCGLQEPMDVRFDSDLVEISSELDWQAAFIWTDLYLKTSKSPQEMQAMQAITAFDSASTDSDLKASQGSPSITLRPRGSAVLFRRLRVLNNRYPWRSTTREFL